MANIVLLEPGPAAKGGPGAMGGQLLRHALQSQGHFVEHVYRGAQKGAAQTTIPGTGSASWADARERPDAYFVSMIYTRQYLHLRDAFAWMELPPLSVDRCSNDPLVVFGGQVVTAPEPIAPFADVVALGDGELTGNYLAGLLDEGYTRYEILQHVDGKRGFYVPSLHACDSLPTVSRWESPSIDGDLVYVGDGGRRPTLEVARGCKSKCAFCPIGWAGGTYREAPLDALQRQIEEQTQRGYYAINAFAPDYSSVSYVDSLDDVLTCSGVRNRGVDARLDRARAHVRRTGRVKQFAFGVEGFSERIRRAVGKPLSRQVIREAMDDLRDSRVKWYLITGFPGEDESDLEELLDTLEYIRDTRKLPLDLTVNALQAVPHTPLERVSNYYDEAARDRHTRLRDTLRQWYQDLGKQINAYQMKSRETHEHDVVLQRAGREAAGYLLKARTNDSYIQSSRWRSDAAEHLDLGVLLGPQTGTTNWDHVDVGQAPDKKQQAASRYAREMKLDERLLCADDMRAVRA